MLYIYIYWLLMFVLYIILYYIYIYQIYIYIYIIFIYIYISNICIYISNICIYIYIYIHYIIYIYMSYIYKYIHYNIYIYNIILYYIIVYYILLYLFVFDIIQKTVGRLEISQRASRWLKGAPWCRMLHIATRNKQEIYGNLWKSMEKSKKRKKLASSNHPISAKKGFTTLFQIYCAMLWACSDQVVIQVVYSTWPLHRIPTSRAIPSHPKPARTRPPQRWLLILGRKGLRTGSCPDLLNVDTVYLPRLVS